MKSIVNMILADHNHYYP